MKSIFARAVIGSPGVVTNSITITAVCSIGALVDIWNNNQGHFVMANTSLPVNRHNSVALFRFSIHNKIYWGKRRGASIHCGQLNELLEWLNCDLAKRYKVIAHVLERFIRCSFTFPRLLIDNKQAEGVFHLNFALLTYHLASNTEWFIFVWSKGLCLLSKAYIFGL